MRSTDAAGASLEPFLSLELFLSFLSFLSFFFRAFSSSSSSSSLDSAGTGAFFALPFFTAGSSSSSESSHLSRDGSPIDMSLMLRPSVLPPP
ncbi:hypothetical protein T484DRAFT_1925628, partial [Baffinella frigidus]